MSLASKYTGRLKASYMAHTWLPSPMGFLYIVSWIFFLIFIIIRNRVSPKELCNQRFQSRVIENNNFLSLPFPYLFFWPWFYARGWIRHRENAFWQIVWQPRIAWLIAKVLTGLGIRLKEHHLNHFFQFHRTVCETMKILQWSLIIDP